MKKVAVIGAGASGLCVAKHLLLNTDGVELKLCVFEQNSTVGGTWIYDENADDDVHTSLYKNLRTDLPKQVMSFPDFPYPEEGDSYIQHTVVRKYLEDYAENFNVVPHIRFQTKVVSVDPLPKKDENDEWCRWLVKYQQVDCQLETEEFDAVVVCNGHYAVPQYPTIPGLENFKGKVLHSHFYRDPEDFKETVKKALVLGFGPSGQDIGLDLVTFCQTMYISHKGDRIISKLPDNVIELSSISHVTDDGAFVTETGDVIPDIDLFLICTGYKVDFPFLNENSGVKVEYNGKLVHGLYKHMFCIENPSLSIVGLPFKTLLTQVAHLQSKYLTRVLSGVIKLPSKESMNEETRKEIEEEAKVGSPPEKFHFFLGRTMPYCDELAKTVGCQKIAEVVWKLTLTSLANEARYVTNFKKVKFRILTNTEFETLNPEILEI